jgi:hypothetical protein
VIHIGASSAPPSMSERRDYLLQMFQQPDKITMIYRHNNEDLASAEY